MLKQLIILVIVIFSSAPLLGQDEAVVDSLLHSLELSKPDTHRVHLYNELAFSLIYSNPDSAKVYANKALELAEAIHDKTGEASAYMRLGIIAMINGNYERAESLFQLALSLRETLGNSIDIASTYNNLGLLQFYQYNDIEAIKFHKKGLEALEGMEISEEGARLCYNIGESYISLGDYEEAIRFITQGLVISEKLGDDTGRASTLLNLGNWYIQIENFEKALESFNLSLELYKKAGNQQGQAKCFINLGNVYYELGKFEVALNHFDKALNLKSSLGQNDIASIYQGKGNIYRTLNKIEEAINAFRTSLDIFSDTGTPSNIASIQLDIGILYKNLLDFKTALNYFKKSQIILDSISDPFSSMMLAQELSETYAELGKMGLAYKYSKKHNELQDSLNNNSKMAINYIVNYEEQQKKYELLENEYQFQLLKNDQEKLKINFLIGLGILWLLLSIATIFAYFNRRKRRLAEQKVTDAYIEIDSILKEQQLQTTYAKLEGQDQERARIAQDLHDRVGSILSTVMLYFKGFDTKLDAIQLGNKSQLVKANELLDKAVVEVRRISKDVHSGTLQKFGLKAELDTLVDILKDSNHIKVKVITHGLEERLPAAMEIKIYRIIQELISNVLKHAKASTITIQVNQFKDVLNVVVEDDGEGFDQEKAKKKNSMGLKNVESRVYDLHGSIIIDSLEGRGTTVAIDIPLED